MNESVYCVIKHSKIEKFQRSQIKEAINQIPVASACIADLFRNISVFHAADYPDFSTMPRSSQIITMIIVQTPNWYRKKGNHSRPSPFQRQIL